MMKTDLPTVVLFGASLLWGLSWIPLKSIHHLGVEGITLIFGAYGVLALVYIPVIVKHLSRVHLRGLFLIALFGGGANLCFSYALIHGDVVRVMVLFYLLPVWGVMGGYVFLKERVGIKRIFGALCAIVGAVMILGGMDALKGSLTWMDAVAVLAGILFALNNILFRSYQAIAIHAKVGMMFVGCALLSAVIVFVEMEHVLSGVSAMAWLAVVAYAICWLLLANIGSQWGVTHMEAGKSSIIIIMELVTAVVSAAWLGEKSLSGIEYGGGALVILAALLEALGTSDDELKENV